MQPTSPAPHAKPPLYVAIVHTVSGSNIPMLCDTWVEVEDVLRGNRRRRDTQAVTIAAVTVVGSRTYDRSGRVR